MTKDKIIAELRRSACEDVSPWFRVKYFGYLSTCEWVRDGEWPESMPHDDLRTFFLLVAEALE